MMKYLLLCYILMFIYMLYLIWTAPLIDDDGNIIIKQKKD